MAVSRVANFINKSKTAQSVLRGINKNPAIFTAVSSFALASILRPALIGCFNFKDKKDKKYSQASAVATGLVELGMSMALFFPLNKVIEKASRGLYDSQGSFFHKNNLALRQFKSVTNRVAKLVALVPISLARFALVKPIVDIVFNDKKKKGLNKWA